MIRTLSAALCIILSAASLSAAQPERVSLNGEWSFEQTAQAFPPKKFTRTIPVPGLVHLATPRISQYDKFFKTDYEVESVVEFNFLDRDYTPMYNWYRKKVLIGSEHEGSKVVLNIKKSQYTTMVYVNGMLAGRAIECYTPIRFNITEFVEFGKENEILVMVGDRAWLPSEAAGSTDKEKEHYLPGIWDDVYLSFSGDLCVEKAIFLPSLKDKKVTAKVLVGNMNPPQMLYGSPTTDPCTLDIRIREKGSGKVVAMASVGGTSLRDNHVPFEAVLDVPDPKAWTPEDPFLYEGEVVLRYDGAISDTFSARFGMRDFKAKGRFFYLNDDKYYLRGSNITLQRFFEDPECSDLAWDREWVKKMLIEQPKSIGWNAMRICVGIVPDFWYDLCDEYGILLQNEWLYWQKHGWNDQIRKEYTDWVWSDGNHPSIVIWDAINENWDDFISGTLIPELKQLDPTRVWDAGYMSGDVSDEMDEPHPYRTLSWADREEADGKSPTYPFDMGRLDDWRNYESILDAGVPQLVNEYAWMWLWRDGRPSKLTVDHYGYFVGDDATPDERRDFQAYWLQLETETIRAERGIAGVLAFTLLTNNYGFTGDWFVGRIKDLAPSPTYRWFKHCFAPAAIFIDLPDSRFSKHIAPLTPGLAVPVNLVGVNDFKEAQTGTLVTRTIAGNGTVVLESECQVEIPAYGKRFFPTLLKMPETPGGYLITAEFHPSGSDECYISRRFVRVGDAPSYSYPAIEP